MLLCLVCAPSSKVHSSSKVYFHILGVGFWIAILYTCTCTSWYIIIHTCTWMYTCTCICFNWHYYLLLLTEAAYSNGVLFQWTAWRWRATTGRKRWCSSAVTGCRSYSSSSAGTTSSSTSLCASCKAAAEVWWSIYFRNRGCLFRICCLRLCFGCFCVLYELTRSLQVRWDCWTTCVVFCGSGCSSTQRERSRSTSSIISIGKHFQPLWPFEQ